MKIIAKAGRDDIATVYLAETENGNRIEFVESIQPPIPREEKWVLIVSSLFGCPVGCGFCDAGGFYHGKPSKDEILAQIDYMVKRRFPSGNIPVKKFKVQFARMGEPAFNMNVLDVLEEFPTLYNAPGFMPSISTVAPNGTDSFFERLLDIKQRLYREKFQLQFSIHTTDEKKRDWLIPVKKWDFKTIADYGARFFEIGDRKITLNFALAENMPIDSKILFGNFDPNLFLIKITPVNPTFRANSKSISSCIIPDKLNYSFIDDLKKAGYDVILSIGELEENQIGSNCGQYLTSYIKENTSLTNGYTYQLQET